MRQLIYKKVPFLTNYIWSCKQIRLNVYECVNINSSPFRNNVYSLIMRINIFYHWKKKTGMKMRTEERSGAQFEIQIKKIFIYASIDEIQFNDFPDRKLKNLCALCTVLVSIEWKYHLNVCVNGMMTLYAPFMCVNFICIRSIHFYSIRGRDREMILADAVNEQFRLE